MSSAPADVVAPASRAETPAPRPVSLAAPLVWFFVSGACALVYQVVWVRRMVLLTGTTTAAVSTVLGVFMAGLGLGAWIFGVQADRSSRPLKLYAYLEAGIALYALALPWLLGLCTPLYVEAARELAGRPAALLLLRVTLGFLLLIVPTALMGGTFPALVRHVASDPARFGTHLGVLYSTNLAGGVAGSLAAGFVLIRALGVDGATMAAVLANLAVAASALLWRERRASPAAAARAVEPPAIGRTFPPAARPLVWATVAFSGVLTMAYEVLWTRILVFPFQSTVYAFTLILATFLTGLALGSRLYVAAERRADPLRVLALAQALAGLSALVFTPLSLYLVDVMRLALLWIHPGAGVFLAVTALCAALVMLVPATFMGVVLPLGMRLLVEDLARSGRQVGLAYLANTGGSVAGALLAGFALIPLLGLKHALLLLAGAQVALGGAFLGHLALPPPRRRQVLAASAALLAVTAGGAAWLLSGPSPFDLQNLRGSGRPVIHAHRDAVGSSVSVVSAHAGEKMLRIDGVNAALQGARAGYMPMMAHIPMLLHPDPRRLLVICFGTGSTAGAGLLHDGTTIDVVDINPVVFDFAPHFVRWNHGVAHDPRARLIVDDGRNYLLTSRERYDVITSEPMPPRFAGVVNLYSREYYLLARERLRPGGLMVQWVPFHLVSVAEGLQILRTVREVFPHTTLWLHGYTGIVVARRDGEIAVDLPRVRRALASPALREDLAAFGVGDALAFAGLHALGPDAIARAVAAQPPITDDRPSLEFHPPTSRAQEMRQIPGSDLMFTREMSRSVEIVHRLRLAGAAPLTGATPAEARGVARARARESHETLGRLYALWGQHAAAAAELEAAARLSAPAGGGAR